MVNEGTDVTEKGEAYVELFVDAYRQEAREKYRPLYFKFPLSKAHHDIVLSVNRGQAISMVIQSADVFSLETSTSETVNVDMPDLGRLLTEAPQRYKRMVEEYFSLKNVVAHAALLAPFENREEDVRREARETVQEHYESLRASDEAKDQYFVAHEFTKAMNDLRKAVETALEGTGLSPYYADAELREGHIFLDKILPKIKYTRFGIYDVSNLSKPNVFAELGAAIALEKRYIIIVRTGTEIPADLQGLDRIEYESFQDLTNQLRAKAKTHLS